MYLQYHQKNPEKFTIKKREKFQRMCQEAQEEYLGRLLSDLSLGKDCLSEEEKKIFWELLNSAIKNRWPETTFKNNLLLTDIVLIDKKRIELNPELKRLFKESGEPVTEK